MTFLITTPQRKATRSTRTSIYPKSTSKVSQKSLAAKRAETERLAALLQVRAEAAASLNPTRVEFVERIEALIEDYNSASVNIDEYLTLDRLLVAAAGAPD